MACVNSDGSDANREAKTNTGGGDRDTAQGGVRRSAVLVLGVGKDETARRPRLDGLAHVAFAESVEEALERIAHTAFDAVLVTPRYQDTIRRIRQAATDAAILLLDDGDVGRDGPRAPTLTVPVDGRVVPDAGVAETAHAIHAAVERRLRARLRQARAAVATSESRFRAIIERTADGVVIVDQGGLVRYVNAAAERLFGRRRAELVGHEFGRALVDGETTEMDILRHAGEPPVIAELRASGTVWEGKPAQIIALRDITDRRNAEDRARRLLLEQAARVQAEKAGERWRFLAEAGQALDASLDPDVTLANLARVLVPHLADWCVIDLLDDGVMRRVAGLHADAGRQALIEELRLRYPPRPGAPHPSVRVMETGCAVLHAAMTPEQLRSLAVDDGHADLLVRLGVRSLLAVPIPVGDRCIGTLTLACGEHDFEPNDEALVREIANRAGRALENAQLHEAALAASKAKSDFLTIMSHELRTPLNGVLGFTELLLHGVAGEVDGTQQKYLQRIHASAHHLLRLIEEILQYASMEGARGTVQPRNGTIGAVVDELVAVVEPLARAKQLAFKTDVPDRDAALFTDTPKLRQLALNLLTNAVKFTDTGTVSLSARVRDGELVLVVADTGRGIPAEHLQRMFEPFWQEEGALTRMQGGTGLGLAISKRLARLLGGELAARSAPGEGSVFTLRVPARISARPRIAGS